MPILDFLASSLTEDVEIDRTMWIEDRSTLRCGPISIHFGRKYILFPESPYI